MTRRLRFEVGLSTLKALPCEGQLSMRRAGWQAAVAVCWTRTAAAFKTEKRLKKYAAVNGQCDRQQLEFASDK
jgi:hypothetical protein